MEQKGPLVELGRQVWEFRREMGFAKALPWEIRERAVGLLESGISLTDMGNALGVPKTTVSDWAKKYSKSSEAPEPIGNFQEVQVVEERPVFEVRVTAKVQGCCIEIRGAEFVVLQRLLRKLTK